MTTSIFVALLMGILFGLSVGYTLTSKLIEYDMRNNPDKFIDALVEYKRRIK